MCICVSTLHYTVHCPDCEWLLSSIKMHPTYTLYPPCHIVDNCDVWVWQYCHVSWMSVTFLPECPDACDMRPLEAGEQLRSMRTMAAVHSVMITGLPLRRSPNIFFSEPGHSSPRRRWSLRSLWPDLRPRRGLAPASSPELLSSSSDRVSLPRLFLDLKK